MYEMKVKLIEDGIRDFEDGNCDFKVFLDTEYYDDLLIGDVYRISEPAKYFVNLYSKLFVRNFSSIEEAANDIVDFIFTKLNIDQ